MIILIKIITTCFYYLLLNSKYINMVVFGWSFLDELVKYFVQTKTTLVKKEANI